MLTENKTTAVHGRCELPCTCEVLDPPTQRIYIRTAELVYPILPAEARKEFAVPEKDSERCHTDRFTPCRLCALHGVLFSKLLRKVEKIMENKRFLNVNDVADYLDISVPTAYKIIRRLNDELSKMGYLTVSGRVSKTYFEQKVYGGVTA